MFSTDRIGSVYTSGRKCNFQKKGCEAPQLQPINVHGWYVIVSQKTQQTTQKKGSKIPTNQPRLVGVAAFDVSDFNFWSPRFWADGNTRIPPTNIPRYITVKCWKKPIDLILSVPDMKKEFQKWASFKIYWAKQTFFSPMTFWSNTGEALQRQPDNYYGLQVSKLSLRYVDCGMWV